MLIEVPYLCGITEFNSGAPRPEELWEGAPQASWEIKGYRG